MTQSYRDCPERNVSQLPQYKCVVLLFLFPQDLLFVESKRVTLNYAYIHAEPARPLMYSWYARMRRIP